MAPVLYQDLDHQGERAGPHDNHHRNAHKEIFHVHRSTYARVCINDLNRTEYREVKLCPNQNENYLSSGRSYASEFG